MKLYRFSPIDSLEQFEESLRYIHDMTMKMCFSVMWEYLPNSGNIALFCHYPREYTFLMKMIGGLVDFEEHVYGKYYKFYTPYTFPIQWTELNTTYKYLYIRKPDPYRFHVGDIDFYLAPRDYNALKQKIKDTWKKWLRTLDRTDVDMMEMYDWDSDVLAYITTQKFI